MGLGRYGLLAAKCILYLLIDWGGGKKEQWFGLNESLAHTRAQFLSSNAVK